jgi:hypothetical protein
MLPDRPARVELCRPVPPSSRAIHWQTHWQGAATHSQGDATFVADSGRPLGHSVRRRGSTQTASGASAWAGDSHVAKPGQSQRVAAVLSRVRLLYRLGRREARMPSSAVGRPRSRVCVICCLQRALRRLPRRSGGIEAAAIVRTLVRFAGVEARRSFRGIVARPGLVRDTPAALLLRVVRLAMARRPCSRSGPGTSGRAIRRSYGSSRPMCRARPIASLREETPSFR